MQMILRATCVVIVASLIGWAAAHAQGKGGGQEMRRVDSIPIRTDAAPGGADAAPFGAGTIGVHVADTAALVGTWEGALSVPGGELPVVFHIEQAEGAQGEEALAATMDSPQQGATGIPVATVAFDGDSLRLEVPAIGGAYAGAVRDDTIRGTWTQMGQSLPLTLRRVEQASAVPQRPQMPEPPFPYAAEDVRFRSAATDSITLAGTLTVPEGAGPHPAVVLISGSGPQDRDETIMGHKPFLVLADHLARQGIAALRYDERGVGESTGTFAGATSADLAREVEGAVRFLEARSEIGPVGLVGHSEGGAIAPMVAGRTNAVDYLVLLAGPAVRGDRLLARQNALVFEAMGMSAAGADAYGQQMLDALARVVAVPSGRPVPDSVQAALRADFSAAAAAMPPSDRAVYAPADSAAFAHVLDRMASQLTQSWMRYFVSHDPAPVLRRLDVPVLALFGSKDLQVPPAQNATPMRAALAAHDAATVHVLDGLNHLFQPAATGLPMEYAQIETTLAPRMLETVTLWIRAQTVSRGE